MNTIGIFTSTRAEFGIIRPLIKKIELTKGLEYRLFAGGTHLKNEHGDTIKEIHSEDIEVSATFDYLSYGDTPYSLTKDSAKATYLLADIFNEIEFDFVCILGDRYELLSIVQTAILFRKPIIHIQGGEITRGAMDDQIRNMITKASHLHFVSCDIYRNNVINMGEEEWRVHNTGSLASENILDVKSISKEEIFNILNLKLNLKTALLTFHPETIYKEVNAGQQISIIFKALAGLNLQIVMTATNADIGREKIIEEIKNLTSISDYHYFESLGWRKYLALLKNSDIIIGNSSSGLIEAPMFRIPTINIGTRQEGRVRHKSIIDVDFTIESIIEGINKAFDNDFQKSIKTMRYKFGNGTASQKIIEAILKFSGRKDLLVKKLVFK